MGLPAKSGNAIEGKKCIVIGAGIAGLAFVLSLQKSLQDRFPDVVIYEKLNSINDLSNEGYPLPIRSDKHGVGGYEVLDKLGIMKEVMQCDIAKSGNGMHIWNKDWKIRQRMDNSNANLLVTRNNLWNCLKNAIQPGPIFHFGTPCSAVNHLDNGRILLKFENDTFDECDILVVADGSFSKIREMLRKEAGISFAGASGISGNSYFSQSIPKPVDTEWGALLNDGTVVFVARLSKRKVVWSLTYLNNQPRPASRNPSDSQGEALLSEALQRGSLFAEPFATLVQTTAPSATEAFNLWERQPLEHSQSSPIAFIGDANHAISQFGGNGGNLALCDAWDLAEQILARDCLSSALAAFDALVVPRAKQAYRRSRWTLALLHSKGWQAFAYHSIFKIISFFSLK